MVSAATCSAGVTARRPGVALRMEGHLALRSREESFGKAGWLKAREGLLNR
jgi:hypothetical protein